ncbi:hypothetical protein [uncultured Gammaproteobacteria bacterium]|uniref:hypothetical protein n=1 Tax=Bathymodiolus heckerae thiotrophic gill symbiont TaxID=1052212 RepID=UPI0010B1978B|nr:hypothetical protein [Bathymodiolus heckerae thiotrophic gill symbiont]CAC9439117.1 hypothetical protein [uncultured Gammaproteobacteria bacterium]SMN13951.1 hypothetical protein BHECKSOX2_1181 [Bathymodiolus heckerae thiotrophic gill symbiont]
MYILSNATSNTQKAEVKTTQISINPKLANAMLLIITLTIFHQIANNNGLIFVIELTINYRLKKM